MYSQKGFDTKERRSDNPNIFGQSLRDPILGKHFKLPGKSAVEQPVVLDTSLSYIPVYTHLKVYETDFLKCPTTPPSIRRIEKEEYMEFYTQSKTTKKNPDAASVEMLCAKKEENNFSKTSKK